jgi:hypothetical protein
MSVPLQSLGSLLADTYLGVDGGRKESRGTFRRLIGLLSRLVRGFRKVLSTLLGA